MTRVQKELFDGLSGVQKFFVKQLKLLSDDNTLKAFYLILAMKVDWMMKYTLLGNGFISNEYSRSNNKQSFSANKKRVDVKPKDVEVSDADREGIKEGVKHELDFGNLVEKSDQLLIKIKAVFPFDFFPNEISVDVNKVNIVNNYFLSQRVHSILIKDISDIYLDSSILFASLNIIDWGFNNNKSITINYLKKDEASQTLNIIQGLMVSSRQNIDLSKIDVPDFKNKVEILGEPIGMQDNI